MVFFSIYEQTTNPLFLLYIQLALQNAYAQITLVPEYINNFHNYVPFLFILSAAGVQFPPLPLCHIFCIIMLLIFQGSTKNPNPLRSSPYFLNIAIFFTMTLLVYLSENEGNI